MVYHFKLTDYLSNPNHLKCII